MKKKKTIICAAAALAVISAGCVGASAASLEPTTGFLNISLEEVVPKPFSLEISLDKKNVVSKVGKKVKLNTETNAEGYDVTYSSTNKKVATVSENGVVKLKKSGKAKIIASCNGVEKVCKVTVKPKAHIFKDERNTIKDKTMSSIASQIGCQTNYAYASSSIMCSAYSYAYAYYQVTGQLRTPGSFWYGGGCTWAGGTYSRYGSREAMLSAIKSSLDKNKACVGLLSTGRSSTHYVTFYGYTGNGDTLSDFKILDPWNGNLTTGAGYGYSYTGYHVVTVNG